MLAEGEQCAAIIEIGRFNTRRAVLVQNTAFRQFCAFAPRYLNFPLGNDTRGVVNDKRRSVSCRHTDGKRVGAKSSLRAAVRHRRAPAFTACSHSDKADTSRRGGLLGIFPQTPDMPGVGNADAAGDTRFRLFDGPFHAPARGVVSKPAPAINAQRIVSLGEDFRFRSWLEVTGIHASQICRDTEHAVRIVPGQVRLEENLGDILGDVPRGTGGDKDIARDCVQVRCLK